MFSPATRLRKQMMAAQHNKFNILIFNASINFLRQFLFTLKLRIKLYIYIRLLLCGLGAVDNDVEFSFLSHEATLVEFSSYIEGCDIGFNHTQ